MQAARTFNTELSSRVNARRRVLADMEAESKKADAMRNSETNFVKQHTLMAVACLQDQGSNASDILRNLPDVNRNMQHSCEKYMSYIRNVLEVVHELMARQKIEVSP